MKTIISVRKVLAFICSLTAGFAVIIATHNVTIENYFGMLFAFWAIYSFNFGAFWKNPIMRTIPTLSCCIATIYFAVFGSEDARLMSVCLLCVAVVTHIVFEILKLNDKKHE